MAESREYKLSQSKHAFMTQHGPDSKIKKGSPVQLSATELPKLADHYFKKHKILILINGETDLGVKLIREGLCLTEEQCVEEIYYIQKSLATHEGFKAVGYVLTSNTTQDSRHFEAVIITQDKIIKPATWDRSYIQSELVYEPRAHGAMPQAGRFECGTLSFLYLKELLKENAKQLTQESFLLDYYDRSDNPKRFFFPSPEVLRYSQSSLYNKFLVAMLMHDEAEVEVAHAGETYSVKTIKKMIDRSMVIARVNGNNNLIVRHKVFLASLPAFRAKWLAAYEASNQKRELMQSDVNLYLACCTHRMRAIANKPVPSMTAERLAAMETLPVMSMRI